MRKRAASVILVIAVALGLAAYPALILSGDKATFTAEQVKRGEYMVTIAGCHDCHTPKIFSDKGMKLDDSRLMSGHPAPELLPAIPGGVLSPNGWGALMNKHLTAFAGPWGITCASNLTPHLKTGIGQWNAGQFIKAMRTGKHRGFGRPIMPPMPWENLAHATDEDLTAMFAYLMSLPPIDNPVPEPVPPQAH